MRARVDRLVERWDRLLRDLRDLRDVGERVASETARLEQDGSQHAAAENRLGAIELLLARQSSLQSSLAALQKQLERSQQNSVRLTNQVSDESISQKLLQPSQARLQALLADRDHLEELADERKLKLERLYAYMK